MRCHAQAGLFLQPAFDFFISPTTQAVRENQLLFMK